MSITYENQSQFITVGDCLNLQKYDINIIFDEGRHVTLEFENKKPQQLQPARGKAKK